ncbi:hypothetical protein JYU14_05400, partial [Simkania negevensis]|nr:hypothetical protein [Simkania negevensis]
MECPLCATDNDDTQTTCIICGSSLTSVEEVGTACEQVDYAVGKDAKALRQKTDGYLLLKAMLLITIVALVLAPWVMMYDLFLSPARVERARKEYLLLASSYQANAAEWDAQKEQLLAVMQRQGPLREVGEEPLSFDSVPAELFFSILANDLNFVANDERGSTFSFLPSEKGKSQAFVLTKYEDRPWPLRILDSLEFVLEEREDGSVRVVFTEFRRGKRSLSPLFAWQYFAPELQRLRYFQPFANGVRSFRTAVESSDRLVPSTALFSWQ